MGEDEEEEAEQEGEEEEASLPERRAHRLALCHPRGSAKTWAAAAAAAAVGAGVWARARTGAGVAEVAEDKSEFRQRARPGEQGTQICTQI